MRKIVWSMWQRFTNTQETSPIGRCVAQTETPKRCPAGPPLKLTNFTSQPPITANQDVLPDA